MNRLSNPVKPNAFAIALRFLSVYVIWGSTYLAIRYAVETIPPLLHSAARFLTAGVLLFIVARLKGAAFPKPKEWLGSGIIGSLLLFLGNGSVATAEKTVPSGLVALIVSVSPVWVAGMEWFKTKKTPHILTIAGVILGFGGMYWLSEPLMNTPSSEDGISGKLGVGLLLFATFTWSLGSVYAKSFSQAKDPLMAAASQMLVAGVLLLGMATALGDWNAFRLSEVSIESLTALGYLIFFGSLIAYTSYLWLVEHIKPTQVVTYAYVNPVVAVLLGWLIAGEEITAQSLVAGAICLISVFLMTRDKG